MNLINKKVTHKLFGMGSIVKHNDSSIEIHFTSENKLFIFPDVFKKHLTLHDKSDAKSLEEMILKKEMEQKEEEWKKEEEKKLQRKKLVLRWEHEKLMKHHKIHPEAQMVFWCNEEERKSSLSEWKVFSGTIKNGNNKGKPSKPSRLHQNSAVLLTTRDSNMAEKDRRILGVYMVNEDFIGKLCEDGNIPAHSKYRLQLTEQESDQLLFWTYYVNAKSPEKVAWNTGKHRYFDNLWLAQILLDIISVKSDPEERELANQFFKYFCKMNQITIQELPKPNGVLTRI